MREMTTTRLLWVLWCLMWCAIWGWFGFFTFGLSWLLSVASVGAIFIPIGKRRAESERGPLT